VKGQEDFAGSDGDGVEQDGKKVQQPQLISRTRSKKQTCYSSGCCDCYIAHIALTSVLLIANTWSNALTGISSCQYVHNVLQQKRFPGASRTRDKHILFQIHGLPPPKRMMRKKEKEKKDHHCAKALAPSTRNIRSENLLKNQSPNSPEKMNRISP
jgi:hypothetical protein